MILLENLHLKNKLQYQFKNNLEFYEENIKKNVNTAINHLSQGNKCH